MASPLPWPKHADLRRKFDNDQLELGDLLKLMELIEAALADEDAPEADQGRVPLFVPPNRQSCLFRES